MLDIIDTNALIDDVNIIKTLKVVVLKKQLSIHKLHKTGNKKEIIERLVQTIENGVGNADTTSGEPSMAQSGTNCTSPPSNIVQNNK